MQVACGQCIGCRLERSRQWAVRCMHEIHMYEKNCFITLTYDEEHLPKDYSLDMRHFQLFMKRLRKKHGNGIRFFHCGEYGDAKERPHYHAILFNFDFDDRKLWKLSNGVPVYTSESLEKLWGKGFCTVGAATFQSAAYVARYVLKKRTGPGSARYYERMDPETGEIFELKPEYVTMSRRPGIGKDWIEEYWSDVWPHDYVVVNAHKTRPPRFYEKQLEAADPSAHKQVKRERKAKNLQFADNQTPERLLVREKVQQSRLDRLKREGVE